MTSIELRNALKSKNYPPNIQKSLLKKLEYDLKTILVIEQRTGVFADIAWDGTIDFHQADFRRCDFRGIVIEANFAYANFEGADLRGSNLERSILIKTNFHKANLENANLNHTLQYGINLLDANLNGTTFKGVNKEYKGDYVHDEVSQAVQDEDKKVVQDKKAQIQTLLRFSEILHREIKVDPETGIIDLRDANLRHADLRGIDLTNCNLDGADLEKADMRGANFENTSILGANFYKAKIKNSSFPVEKKNDCYFGKNEYNQELKRKHTLLSKQLLDTIKEPVHRVVTDEQKKEYLKPRPEQTLLTPEQTIQVMEDILHHSILDKDLTGVDLSGADLTNCDLTKMNLYGANLQGAILLGAKLDRTNLENTNLAETVVAQCMIHNCNLEGAITKDTKFYANDISYTILTDEQRATMEIEGNNLSNTNFSNDEKTKEEAEAILATLKQQKKQIEADQKVLRQQLAEKKALEKASDPSKKAPQPRQKRPSKSEQAEAVKQSIKSAEAVVEVVTPVRTRKTVKKVVPDVTETVVEPRISPTPVPLAEKPESVKPEKALVQEAIKVEVTPDKEVVPPEVTSKYKSSWKVDPSDENDDRIPFMNESPVPKNVPIYASYEDDPGEPPYIPSDVYGESGQMEDDYYQGYGVNDFQPSKLTPEKSYHEPIATVQAVTVKPRYVPEVATMEIDQTLLESEIEEKAGLDAHLFTREKTESLLKAILKVEHIGRTAAGGFDLNGKDLHGQDISCFNLSESAMETTNLRDVKGKWVNLYGVNANESDWTNAQITYSNVRSAHFIGASMKNTKGYKNDWFQSVMNKANFRGSFHKKSHFKSCLVQQTDVAGADFPGCSFSYTNTKTMLNAEEALLHAYDTVYTNQVSTTKKVEEKKEEAKHRFGEVHER